MSDTSRWMAAMGLVVGSVGLGITIAIANEYLMAQTRTDGTDNDKQGHDDDGDDGDDDGDNNESGRVCHHYAKRRGNSSCFYNVFVPSYLRILCSETYNFIFGTQAGALPSPLPQSMTTHDGTLTVAISPLGATITNILIRDNDNVNECEAENNCRDIVFIDVL